MKGGECITERESEPRERERERERVRTQTSGTRCSKLRECVTNSDFPSKVGRIGGKN